MASGYERREPVRNTFAFQAPEPVQVRPSAQGNFRGADIVGGRSTGGYEAAPATSSSGASELGAYFEELLQPAIQRKQQEQFIKGVTDQMSRQAGDEIRTSNGLFSKIFGPTAYQEGAIFYSAKKISTDWQQELLNDPELHKLPPQELSKVVAERIEAAKTGDPLTDQAAQAAILEASGPLLATVVKKRYVWQQQQTYDKTTQAWDSNFSSLQAIAVANAALTDPSDADNLALSQAEQSFRAGMVKPVGMDDETYTKAVFASMKKAMQDGNFYGVEVLRAAGFDKVLSAEDQVRLEDAYQRYADRSLGDTMANSPDLQRRLGALIELEAKVRTGEVKATGADVSAEYAAINDEVKRRSGVQGVDLFDWKKQLEEGKGIVDATVSAYLDARHRREQIEDREDAQQFQLDKEQRDREELSAQVQATFGAGLVQQSILGGIAASNYEQAALADYGAGNFSRMLSEYRASGWYSKSVANAVQAKVQNAAYAGQYSEAAKRSHAEWKALNTANPAAAAQYYGKYHTMMLNFDSQITGGLTPNLAFQAAFQNPAQYSTVMMPRERQKEAREVIAGRITSGDWRWYKPWGKTPLNASSARVMTDALWQQGALMMQYSSVSTPKGLEAAASVIGNNGTVEVYGPFAIRNAPDTTPLHRLLKVQPDEASDAIVGLIDQKMRAVGFSSGAWGDEYNVRRFVSDGKPVLMVQALDDDAGKPQTAIITFDEMLQATDRQHGAAYRASGGRQPYRPNRVMQKVIRQNKAEKAKFGTDNDVLPLLLDAAKNTPVVAAGRAASAVVGAAGDGLRHKIQVNSAKRAERKAKRK